MRGKSVLMTTVAAAMHAMQRTWNGDDRPEIVIPSPRGNPFYSHRRDHTPRRKAKRYRTPEEGIKSQERTARRNRKRALDYAKCIACNPCHKPLPVPAA